MIHRKAKFIIVPYRSDKGRLRPAEMREAISETEALFKAEMLALRFAAVVAAEVVVDLETGEMDDPRFLVMHGIDLCADDDDATAVAA